MKKWFYKAGISIAGVLFVASTMTLFAPKTVHALVSALVTVANTSSNPVPAQEVKESRSNYVSVSFSQAFGAYNEVAPDGTVSSTPFTIPSGEQFVITDVSWVTVCANLFGSLTCSKSTGDSVIFMLGSNAGQSTGSYMSRSTYAGGTGFLNAGRSDSFKSGLVVTQLPTPSILFPSGGGEEILVVNLRGYLVP